LPLNSKEVDTAALNLLYASAARLEKHAMKRSRMETRKGGKAYDKILNQKRKVCFRYKKNVIVRKWISTVLQKEAIRTRKRRAWLQQVVSGPIRTYKCQ